MSFCHRGVGVGNGNSNSNSSNGNNVDHCGGTDDDSLILGVEPSASVVSATVPITTRTDSNLLNHLHQHHINNNGGEKNGCYYDSGGGGGTTTNRFDHFDDLELGTSTDDQVRICDCFELLLLNH